MPFAKLASLTLALAILASLAAAPALANIVQISGSGTWTGAAPVTAESSPNATWSFSLLLPNPIATNPTTQATSFAYYLNGMPVNIALASVTFFSAADGGMFDLNIANGDTITLEGVSGAGADVGSSLALVLGTYPSAIAMGDTAPIRGTGTVVISASPVPEPASLTLLGAALAGFALFFRRQARRGSA